MQSQNTKTAYLGLGTNEGQRYMHLETAHVLLQERVGPVVRASGIYETQAWGVENQPDFLNQVVEVRTQLEAEALLQVVLEIEKDMGRKRRIKWGQRLIDIDILFYEQAIVDTPTLTVPHPYLHERNFVLVPFREIAPDWVHPVFKQTIAELEIRSLDPLQVMPTVLW